MTDLQLLIRCRNSSLSYTATKFHEQLNATSAQAESRDRNALLYIVVTLLFYSIGIVIAIVMYLKKEKNEILEEKMYEAYFSVRADPCKDDRYYRMQKIVSRLDKVEEAKRNREQIRKLQEPMLERSRSVGAGEGRAVANLARSVSGGATFLRFQAIPSRSSVSSSRHETVVEINVESEPSCPIPPPLPPPHHPLLLPQQEDPSKSSVTITTSL